MANPLPSLPLDALAAFCRKWRIKELSLFGSALRDDFGPESDIDFLYIYEPDARWDLSDWLAMQDELEAIVGRRVDFVDRESIEQSPNWYRRRHILATARRLYAA